MKEEIKSLIELDLYYQKKAKDAHDKKVNLEDELKLTKEKLKDEYWQNVKNEVDSEKQKLNEQVSETILINKEKFKEVSEKLTKQYTENREDWLNELFERTISI